MYEMNCLLRRNNEEVNLVWSSIYVRIRNGLFVNIIFTLKILVLAKLHDMTWQNNNPLNANYPVCNIGSHDIFLFFWAYR